MPFIAGERHGNETLAMAHGVGRLSHAPRCVEGSWCDSVAKPCRVQGFGDGAVATAISDGRHCSQTVARAYIVGRVSMAPSVCRGPVVRAGGGKDSECKAELAGLSLTTVSRRPPPVMVDTVAKQWP